MDQELAEVLGAWNEATARLEKTHELLQHEVRRLTEELEVKNRELARKNRLADLGQMASHIAHEVRNGLVPITVYIGLLKRKLGEDQAGLGILQKLETAFGDLDCTVNDLLHFTSDRKPNKTEIKLDDTVETICRSILPQFESQDIRLYLDIPENLMIPADRDMFRRCLLNLLLNGIDAMPKGGELVVQVKPIDDEEFQAVELTISDTGKGFTEEAIRRATEPFFSTKGTGTGLGLAIVCRIVEVHGGTLHLGNRPEGGAMIRAIFPRYIEDHLKFPSSNGELPNKAAA